MADNHNIWIDRRHVSQENGSWLRYIIYATKFRMWCVPWFEIICHNMNGSQLHCVFRSPFSGRTVMSSFVIFEELSNIWNQRVIRVGIGEKTANRKQHLANSQGRTPLILQNVQTNTSIRVDVTVVDASCKMHLRRLEWIVRRKVNIEKEYSSGVWGVIWSHNCRLPVKHIITNRACWAVCRWVFTQVDKLFDWK